MQPAQTQPACLLGCYLRVPQCIKLVTDNDNNVFTSNYKENCCLLLLMMQYSFNLFFRILKNDFNVDSNNAVLYIINTKHLLLIIQQILIYSYLYFVFIS